ncbi:hypothetical protein ET532_001800, partial [Verminephrobacter sp. Larva24]
ERSACPYRAVLASDATPRCASMASADRQMIGDATPGARRRALPLSPYRRQADMPSIALANIRKRMAGRRAPSPVRFHRKSCRSIAAR